MAAGDLLVLHMGDLVPCRWVPVLFGVAGVILGVGYPYLDDIVQTPVDSPAQASVLRARGSWGWVHLCISLFVIQYWLSGVLDQWLAGQDLQEVQSTLGTISQRVPDVVLLTYAGAHWWVFDRTHQGLAMSLLTAVCGPGIEVALINMLHLYHYSHPSLWGVPTWIPWVYFCGGPAVGNLGRRVWHQLNDSQT